MVDTAGPFRVYCQLASPLPAVLPYSIPIPNPSNVRAIRLINRGPFDLLYSGFGMIGQDWLPANSYIMLYSSASNQGSITVIVPTVYTTGLVPPSSTMYLNTDQTVQEGADLAGAFTSVFISRYYADDDIPADNGIVSMGESKYSGNCQFVDAPGAGGTTVNVPFTPSVGPPIVNVPPVYLLGFDLTTGQTATPGSASLTIQNLATQRDGSNTLTYRYRVESTGGVLISIRYPGIGIPNQMTTSPQPIKFVIGNVAGATIDCCIYYTYIPYFG